MTQGGIVRVVMAALLPFVPRVMFALAPPLACLLLLLPTPIPDEQAWRWVSPSHMRYFFNTPPDPSKLLTPWGPASALATFNDARIVEVCVRSIGVTFGRHEVPGRHLYWAGMYLAEDRQQIPLINEEFVALFSSPAVQTIVPLDAEIMRPTRYFVVIFPGLDRQHVLGGLPVGKDEFESWLVSRYAEMRASGVAREPPPCRPG